MITVKEAARMYGISLMIMCGIIMASLFIGYHFQLQDMGAPADPRGRSLYDSQLQMSLITAIIPTVMFSVFAVLATLSALSNYIQRNSANMGILKAMGYSNVRISVEFAKVAIPVAIGAVIGIIISVILGPSFYSSMGSSELTPPDYVLRPVLTVLLILIPTLVFSVFAVIYAYIRLRRPALSLIKGSDTVKQSKRIRGINQKCSELGFGRMMRKIMMRSHLLVPIFIFIASWGYSATVQMGFTMWGAGIEYGALLCGSIGFLLGIVMMILAEHSVMKTNSKDFMIMKAFGYTDDECQSSILSGCRIVAVIGFIVGIPYQYYTMVYMFSLFDTAIEVPFSWVGLIVTLVSFVAIYEITMYCAKKDIAKLSIKQTMSSD